MQTWTRRFELGTGFPTRDSNSSHPLGRTYGSKKKRNFVVCAAGAGSVDIPYFDSHLHCCGECPGRRGGGVNEKVSECTERKLVTAGVGRGARCSFSDRAAGGVSAIRRGEA